MVPFCDNQNFPSMKLHQLLSQREVLLRQARLANVAFAYQEFEQFALRIARGGLRGEVTLHLFRPDADCPSPPTLIANQGNQSVLEEHFTDHDILELADLIEFLVTDEGVSSVTFRLEDFEDSFLSKLRHELVQAGVEIAGEQARVRDAAKDER